MLLAVAAVAVRAIARNPSRTAVVQRVLEKVGWLRVARGMVRKTHLFWTFQLLPSNLVILNDVIIFCDSMKNIFFVWKILFVS